MGEPAAVEDQRRAGAVHGIRDRHPVRGPGEPDLLRRCPRRVRRHARSVDPRGRV
ncbi:hypothetical protein [Ornithinimicrobium kibberense]|uniref:hypothetical protein n=1 Tax=Ornithinimicrobium kibberense TaxID=282060 RepID=UPI003611C801